MKRSRNMAGDCAGSAGPSHCSLLARAHEEARQSTPLVQHGACDVLVALA